MTGSAAASRPAARRAARRAARSASACSATLLLAVAAAGAGPVAPIASPPTAPFVITCWCGPPVGQFTDDRAAQLAAAGFTRVGSPCEGKITPEANRRALAVAARHGLQLLISDPRFGRDAAQSSSWEAALDAAVAEYGRYPALGGYFVMDEPTASQFDKLAPVVRRLRARDPSHLAYVNLLPSFVPADDLGAKSYADYLEKFITTVNPQLLSYDHYPFGKDKDRTTFFDNLAAVRAAALDHHLPFLVVVQAMPHGPYRDPTEAELAWQVFHAVAFGARGISYFAYWTPVNVRDTSKLDFHYGLIEDGKPTLHYFQARRLNHRVAAIGAALTGFRSIAVADSAGEIGPGFPIGPIENIGGGQITVGLFGDDRGRLAALLVNRDYRYGAQVDVHLRAGARRPRIFDPVARRWDAGRTPSFLLAPGDAKLLLWGTSAPRP